MNKLYKSLCVSLLSIFIFLSAFSQEKQDVLYLNNGEQIECKVIEVTTDKVKYQPINHLEGPVYNIYRSDVALIFKSNGSYLVPENTKSEWVEAADSEVNKIFTSNSQIIPATMVEVNDDIVQYQDANTNETKTFKKEEVIAIIYKDGQHKMFVDPKELAVVLDSLALNINSYSNLDVNKFLELDDVDVTEYTHKALNKTKDLGWYLQLLTDKEEDQLDKQKAVEMACKLFINNADSVWVQVSSLTRDNVRQFFVREYFDRIRRLRYDKVELSWTDISYVSKLRKAEDGNYYGTITFQQLFRGFIDGKYRIRRVPPLVLIGILCVGGRACCW